MIAHLSLYTLKPEISQDRLEEVISSTRVTLLRVPEVLTIRTGKRINPQDKWEWFIMMEVDSLDKLQILRDDPHYIKFREDLLRPTVAEELVQSFEMDPRKDVKYS
jgi:hypothetical protein